METIRLPQLRQTYSYDCGAKALQSVLVYYGIELREDHIIKEADTTRKGTSIKGIISVAEKHGLKYESKKMTLKDIKDYIRKKIPVILALQAWAHDKEVDWESDWKDGHYVVAIGYTKDRVIFVDPSSFERTYLGYDELESRWHDMDSDGKRYFHHGIAIYGKRPRFNKNKIIHMD